MLNLSLGNGWGEGGDPTSALCEGLGESTANFAGILFTTLATSCEELTH